VHLICHLILTKINCITLKIRSKADFKSKSKNIWQQIILCSSTVMKMKCPWHKIWTLSRRLLLMHNGQLMKIYKYIYIFRVYHIRIITKEKLVLVVGNIFRFETCMNSLVKVPPYSILNFQGKNVFTQNWCNITLNNNSPDIYLFILYMVFHVHIYMMVRKYYNDGHDWFDLIWLLVLNDTFSNISTIYHGDQF
jgi:hypothetical protein